MLPRQGPRAAIDLSRRTLGDTMHVDPAVFVGLAGILIGAALSEVRVWLAERRATRRATEAAIVSWQLDRLRNTRMALRRQLAQLEAVALGDLETGHRHALAIEALDFNIALVGDDKAIRAWQDVIFELRDRFGRGLPPDYVLRSARATDSVFSALDEQEERLLSGRPLTKVDPAAAPDLFAPESLLARANLPWRLPSWSAVLGRWLMDFMLWFDARVGPRRRPTSGATGGRRDAGSADRSR